MKTVYNISKLYIEGDGYLVCNLIRSYSNYDSALAYAQELLDAMNAYDEYAVEDARIYFTTSIINEWEYKSFDTLGVLLSTDKLYD